MLIVSLTTHPSSRLSVVSAVTAALDLPRGAVTDCPVVRAGECCFSVARSLVTLGKGEWDSCRLTGRP